LDKSKIKNILIIKLRGIGDVVLSTIVIDNLKTDFPDAKIDYLVESPSAPGLSGIKQINRVLIFERHNFFSKVSLAKSIRKNHYDLVLDFFSNPSTAIITYFSRAKYRMGFPYKGRRYAYNMFGPHERSKFHAAQLHLESLKINNLSYNNKKLHYSIGDDSKVFAKKYFNKQSLDNSFVVGICPTGGWVSKKCDPEKFAEIANTVINSFNAKVLILWGKSDEEDALKIYTQLEGETILAPATTIQELAALISKCSILIANDSGPMHISTAVGTPVLSLHGPTNPHLQGPYGDKHEFLQLEELECINCNLLDCPFNHECFKNITSELILKKVKALISKNDIQITMNDAL
jgi:lipopolysaccharide heptosyltransferase II